MKAATTPQIIGAMIDQFALMKVETTMNALIKVPTKATKTLIAFEIPVIIVAPWGLFR